MHIKHIHETIEKIADCAKTEVCKGVENLDTKEMKEVAEILEALCRAEYYATITKAMGESEYGENNDIDGPIEERRYYRGRARDSMGRFKCRRGYDEMMGYMPEMYRDMDRDSMGRMYYTSGSSTGGSQGQSNGGSSMGSSNSGSMGYSDGMMRDNREGRSGQSRRSYLETKEMHKGNTAEDKEAKRKELDKWMNDIGSDIKELVHDMTPEEKTMAKTKLTNLANSL